LPNLHAGNAHIGTLTKPINAIEFGSQVHARPGKAAPRAGDSIAKEAGRNGQHHQAGQDFSE